MEIYVNTNSPIKHKVYWRGELYEPTNNPTVKVYDVTEDPTITPQIEPTELLITLTSEKLDNDIASYVVYLPLIFTSRYKELELIWEYVINGENVQKKHKVFVRVPYLDITQSTDVLGIGTDPSDPNYKSFFELSEAEKWARKVIENYTGQQFYPYDDLHTVYGSGTDVLPLPYKLNTLHELYQNDILLLDTINNINNSNYDIKISETGFGIRVNKSSMIDNTVYTANGMVPPTINDTSGVFAKDVAYRVQGKYGWLEVPDEVELACIELMKDYFSKDKEWRNKYLTNLQTFDWQFEYSHDSYAGTGNVYVDQILSSYVLTQMVVI